MLTKQLLAFSRTSAIQPRVLDLNERLKDISKLLRPLMGEDVWGATARILKQFLDLVG